jgi:putative ATPase
MENYDAIIIGASTENPFYTLTNAIRSRAFLFEFKALNTNELQILLDMALKHLNITLDSKVEEYIINSSSGDARAMLNLLDYAHKVSSNITLEILKQLRHESMSDGCNANDTHYDLASAMIKSLRGSDIDASLYYLARLIDGAERIEFITRRLMIFASEDIGNANPNALNLATSTHTAATFVGYPEARIILGQCVVFLASCPKSNHSYCAINKALQEIKDGRIINIPNHIKTHSKDYKYPHDFGGWVKQSYLSQAMQFYTPSHIGFEKTLNEWLEKIKNPNKG